MKHPTIRQRSGQSLMEILVGVAIGALFIVGASAIIAPSLQSNKTASLIQTKTELANELMDNVKSWSDGSWNSLLSVATGSTNIYHLVTSASPFVATSGVETVMVGSSTYQRYFYLSDVYRTSAGFVATSSGGNYYDPSTKQLTVGVNLQGSSQATTTYTMYLTRAESDILNQADWSGGGGVTSSVPFLGNTFASETNAIYNASGSLSVIPLYVYRRSITVATSEVSTASGTALTNFPLLVSGTFGFLKASSSAGTIQNPNGYDIIFSSDNMGNNRLNWEVESYTPSTGQLTAWVQMPVLSSSSNVIYMLYDNPYTSTFQGNASGTWDNTFVSVWHFLSAQGGTLDDSTANGDNGTWNGTASGTSGYYSPGFVGSWSGAFDGNTTYVDAGTNTITGTNPFTLSAWINTATTTKYSGAIAIGSSAGGDSAYIGTVATAQVGTSDSIGGGFYGTNLGSSISISNAWEYVALTFSGGSNGTAVLYVNGNRSVSTTFTPNISGTYRRLGKIGSDTIYNFNGLVDEARISNVARSADWISTEYNNQVNPATFYTISAASTP